MDSRFSLGVKLSNDFSQSGGWPFSVKLYLQRKSWLELPFVQGWYSIIVACVVLILEGDCWQPFFFWQAYLCLITSALVNFWCSKVSSKPCLDLAWFFLWVLSGEVENHPCSWDQGLGHYFLSMIVNMHWEVDLLSMSCACWFVGWKWGVIGTLFLIDSTRQSCKTIFFSISSTL